MDDDRVEFLTTMDSNGTVEDHKLFDETEPSDNAFEDLEAR